MTTQRIIPGDCIEGLRTLPDASVHCCVTSPPYWGLRDYGHDGQIGLEPTPEAYVARMVEVFREVRRVLRDDGTLWLNLGDSYTSNGFWPGAPSNVNGSGLTRGAKSMSQRGRQVTARATGLKPKDLVGIPWRVAFALQADGWWLRQDIIWHKPNPMAESVRDRCTKAHEYVFLMTKSERYYYDAEAVSEKSINDGKVVRLSEKSLSRAQATGRGVAPSGNALADSITVKPTRNRRSVWTITTKPYSGAHFAVMPPDLVEPCILAGCPEQCCPVCGKGWSRVVETDAPGKRLESLQAKRVSHREVWIPQSEIPHGRRSKTLGWKPACDCAASGTIPGTVLDPFAGSGTTLAVAAELGRNAIGCELNPEYIALAERRIKDARSSVALFEGVPA